MNSLSLLPWEIKVHPGFLSEPTTFQVKDSAGNAVSDFYLSEKMAKFIKCAPQLLADLTDAAAQLRKLGGEVNAALAARFEATIAAAVGGAE